MAFKFAPVNRAACHQIKQVRGNGLLICQSQGHQTRQNLRLSRQVQGLNPAEIPQAISESPQRVINPFGHGDHLCQ